VIDNGQGRSRLDGLWRLLRQLNIFPSALQDSHLWKINQSINMDCQFSVSVCDIFEVSWPDPDQMVECDSGETHGRMGA
jgi:hypothetical protein